MEFNKVLPPEKLDQMVDKTLKDQNNANPTVQTQAVETLYN